MYITIPSRNTATTPKPMLPSPANPKSTEAPGAVLGSANPFNNTDGEATGTSSVGFALTVPSQDRPYIFMALVLLVLVFIGMNAPKI